MTTFAYTAIDSHGKETKGSIQVADQSEAIRRVKEMGFYPLKVSAAVAASSPVARARRHAARLGLKSRAVTGASPATYKGRIKVRQVAVFTRQLATLLEAGLPLLRGLRLLQEQETDARLRRVIGEFGMAIEGGGTLSDAAGQYPRVFNRLYVNMVKAGELGGALEVSLKRLAEFMEKSEKIKRKVKAAMFYPAAVVTVAAGVMALLMVYVVPRFQEVFLSMMGDVPCPLSRGLCWRSAGRSKATLFLWWREWRWVS